MSKISGDDYIAVDGLGYDSTNKKLMIKVGASTEPIPFSSGGTSYTFRSYAKNSTYYQTLITTSDTTSGIRHAWSTNYEDEFIKYTSTNAISGTVTLKKPAKGHYNGYNSYDYTTTTNNTTDYSVGQSFSVGCNECLLMLWFS